MGRQTRGIVEPWLSCSSILTTTTHFAAAAVVYSGECRANAPPGTTYGTCLCCWGAGSRCVCAQVGRRTLEVY
jgi:hypothetical protein